MKIKKILGMAGLMTLVGLTLTGCGAQNTNSRKIKTVQVAISMNSNPYEYMEGGKLTGYEYDVLTKIDKNLSQYQFKFKGYRDDAILNAVDATRADIAVNNFGKTEERTQKYLFTYPVSKGSNAIFSREADPIKKISGLFGKTTEIPTGTNYGKIMDDWNAKNPNRKIKISYSGNALSDRLGEISSGKIDFLFADQRAAENLVKEHAISGVVDFVPEDLDQYPSFNTYAYFILPEGEEELQQVLNDQIKKLTQDGSLKRLSEKYFGSDQVPALDMMK